MIIRKSREEIEAMGRAGAVVAGTLEYLGSLARPGVTTAELDEAAETYIRSEGGVPTFKGYRGFPAAICTSPNSMVVHGIPGEYTLADGDLISVDVGVTLDGFVADSAFTYPVGEVGDEAERLLDVGQAALAAGIQQARAGKDYGLVRLCLPPLIHGAAQWAVLGALFCGSTVVLVPKFDPAEIWRAIEREKVQVAAITGDAMGRPLIEEFQRGEYDGSSLFIINSSAALFSFTVKKQYQELLPHTTLLESIGSSETGSTGIGAVPKEIEKTDGTKVKLNEDTIVIDDDGNKLEPSPGVIGKLARGGHIPLGYYKDPEKTARMFVEVDGKRFTVPGDYARFEADGDITLLGRGNTCVNTGGEKVFPEEVEAALKSHPDVFDALVIGIPDDLLGQRVGAIVHPREGATPTLSELDAHVRETLAGYKVPRSLWLVGEIGRTPSGKPDYQWAKRHVEEHAHQPV